MVLNKTCICLTPPKTLLLLSPQPVPGHISEYHLIERLKWINAFVKMPQSH